MVARPKVLVLGGYGFIGTAVSEELERKDYRVLRRSRRTRVNLVQYGSIFDCLSRCKPDVIFNCAANVGSMHYVGAHAADVLRDNVMMATNLYRAVAALCPHAHVINPLSNCSYPGDADIQHEYDWLSGEPHPSVFAYATAKRFLFALSNCYGLQHNIVSSNFLVPNAFGPGDSLDPEHTHALSGMIVRMIAAKRAGDPRFEVWGSGKPIREWAYVDDIAKVMVSAVDQTYDLLDPINIAQKHGVSIAQSAKAIKAAVGYRGKLWFNTKHQDGAPKKVMSDAMFREIWPDFKFIDHAEAIKRTVAYYETALKHAN